jgi:hypothetical protein
MKESSNPELIRAAVELATHRFPDENACVAALKVETPTGKILDEVIYKID